MESLPPYKYCHRTLKLEGGPISRWEKNSQNRQANEYHDTSSIASSTFCLPHMTLERESYTENGKQLHHPTPDAERELRWVARLPCSTPPFPQMPAGSVLTSVRTSTRTPLTPGCGWGREKQKTTQITYSSLMGHLRKTKLGGRPVARLNGVKV